MEMSENEEDVRRKHAALKKILLDRCLKICSMLGKDKKRRKALTLAREIKEDYPTVATAYLATAHILKEYCKDLAKSDPEAEKLSKECLMLHSHAVRLAPKCIMTRVRYLKDLSDNKQYEEAILELEQAASINPVEADDPVHHNLFLPKEVQNVTRADQRPKVLQDLIEEGKRTLRPCYIEIVLNLTDAAERMKRARKLAETYPEDFTCLYIRALSTLIYAQDKSSSERAAVIFVENALRAADSAVAADIAAGANSTANACPISVTISLFRARLMLLLGRYEEAETECHRGLNIKNPRDPSRDNISLEHAIKAEGDSYEDRVSNVRGLINKLLNYVNSELKLFWSTMKESEKGKVLISRVDDVLKYSPSAGAAMEAFDDLKIPEDKKQLNLWFCPIAHCPEVFTTAESLSTHLCIELNQEPPQKLSGQSESWSPFRMSLWKTQGGCRLFCLGNADKLFDTRTLWPLSGKSFKELMIMKRRSRKNQLKKIKQTIEGGEDNIRGSNLWPQLLDACLIDYSEFLLPALGLYQRGQLIKQMLEDTNFRHKIDKSRICSIFSAMVANEKEDQQIKCQKDTSIVCHWSEKKQRGYKWFRNADCRISNELGNDWLLDAIQGSVLDVCLPISYVNSGKPVVLDPHPQFLEIQTNWRRLIIFKDMVPGTGTYGNHVLYFAWITGVRRGSPMIRCVVSSKKPLEEVHRMFSILSRCQHPNILKPLGVWPCNLEPSMGYMTFPYFDGAISKISENELFIEEGHVIYEFSEVGHKILRDILSAVHYINMKYDHGEADINDSLLPPNPLKLSVDHIFYVKVIDGAYHILLGFFDTESTQEIGDVDVKLLARDNLNAIGFFLDTLLDGQAFDKEIEHLICALKGASVTFDDLLWEVGFWTVDDKMTFVRDVFWIQDSYTGRQLELANKASSLGIRTFALKIYPGWVASNLYDDFIFIRNNILAHQDGSYNRYTGSKEDIGTQKSTTERSLRKDAPKYMLTLVAEVRALNWPILSPIFRSKSDYNVWFQKLFPSAQPNMIAPGPAT